MNQKVELRYSWMYNSVYEDNFSKKDIAPLKKKCKKFEKLFEKHISEILKLIEKNFRKWEDREIIVYLIDKGPVFSDPLTIRYEEEPKIMLIRLLHELIHVNIKDKKFKNDYIMHKKMDEKTALILEKLSLDLKSQFWVLEKMTEKFRKRFST